MKEFKPWPHQLEALELFKHRGSLLLHHEMGVGKTATTCMCINSLPSDARVLIVCPLAVKPHWQREIAAICDQSAAAATQILDGPLAKRVNQLGNPHKRIFICNYEVATQALLFELILKQKWDFIILDESQRIKSPGSKRSKAFVKLANKAKYRLCLSGSPIVNSAEDIWAQLRVVDPETEANFFCWRPRYFFNANAGKSWINFPDWKLHPERESELQAAIAKCTHRVEKSQCLTLPPLTRQTIECELPKELSRVYKELEEDFIATIGDDAIVTNITLTKLLRLQELCNGVAKGLQGTQNYFTEKHEALADIIEGLGDTKCVVWCNFTSAMPSLISVVEKSLRKGKKFVVFTGEQSAKEKQEAIDALNNDPDTQVFIATQASGGVGIGLQAASVAVYFSKSFHLEHDIQSEARTYRGGSERHSVITRIDLVTKGTVEEVITEALRSKLELGEMLLKIKEVKGWNKTT